MLESELSETRAGMLDGELGWDVERGIHSRNDCVYCRGGCEHSFCMLATASG
jgi:hypothetical protein